MRHAIVAILILNIFAPTRADDTIFTRAEANGRQARDAWMRCQRYVQGWLQHADRTSGLIPRNLTHDAYWNARDAAADNYPFMVLTASMTDRALFEGRLRRMLDTEKRLTCRVGPLPDDFLFATQAFRTADADLSTIIFGASEYAKDGLTPLTEWLGPSPWSERMFGLLNAIVDHSRFDSPAGTIPADSHEVNGEMMQTLARFYWMDRSEAYRQMALRIADYYLLHRLPTEEERLGLNDHGCEIIGGLSEAYFLAAHTDSARRAQYRPAMHKMLDRILEVGRNPAGFFYGAVNPVSGKIVRDTLTDNWGYNYNAFLAVAELDDHLPYRDAVLHALCNLPTVADYAWEGGSADGFADSIEGAINLLNRLPVDVGFDWVDATAKVMLEKQRPDGIIEGWHGDGNYARTAIMYALWKTKGITLHPWRGDVAFGAEQDGKGRLYVVVRADWPWTGKLIFDRPRHRDFLHLPADYPRLNQFPEWFAVDAKRTYRVKIEDQPLVSAPGKDLIDGLRVTAPRDRPVRIVVSP